MFTENKVPIMTSAETTDIKISASANYDNTNFGWMAFDSNTSGGWYVNNNSVPSDIKYHWIKIQFKKTQYKISKIVLQDTSIHGSVKDFIFQGSNDDITWYNLCDIIGPTTYDTNRPKKEYVFNNSTKYYFYRLILKKSYSSYGNGITYGGIAAMELLEQLGPKCLFVNENSIYTINVNGDCVLIDNLNNIDGMNFELNGFDNLSMLAKPDVNGDKIIDRFNPPIRLYKRT